MSIPVLTLVTDKNSTSVDLDRITIRQSEAGLVINANLIDADNNAYNLTNCKVSFGENKDGGKMVDDDNVSITDYVAGQISYKLRPEVYQASGEAWFEITNNANVLIDTTSNFHIEVIKQADLNVDNDNYWSKAEAMLSHVQSFMNKIQNDLNSYENSKAADINSLVSTTTASINKLINDTNATLQNYKDQLATYDAKYKALDTNWAAEIAKLDGQIDGIKQQAVQDFQTQRDNLDAQFTQFEADLKSDLENKLSGVINQIKTLTDTTLPDLNDKVEAVSKKLDDLKLDFASIDFSQFAKPADVTKAIDDLRNELNPKIAAAGKVDSVDGQTGNVVTGAIKKIVLADGTEQMPDADGKITAPNFARNVNGYNPDSSGKIDITDLLNKNFGINAGNAAYRDILANNIMSATQNGNSDSIGNNINWINNWRTTINNAMQSISVLGISNAVIYIRRLLAYMKLITEVAENGNSYYTTGGVSGFSLQRTIYGSFNETISVFNSIESSTFASGHWFYILSLPSPAIFVNNPSAVTGLNESYTIMSAIAFRVSGYSSVYYAPTADILDLIYFSSMV